MRSLQSLLLIFYSAAIALSQQRIEIPRDRMCSWNEDATLPSVLYEFPPDKTTVAAVENIMKHTGLQVNFELVASNVPNAVATVQGSRRLILYNQLFMEDIATQSASKWASMSILAHEIGHHLQQHTLGVGGMKPEQELAADRFSGDILFKMGAPLDAARAAMASRPETKSPYYPAKSARLTAIGNGWIAARELATDRNQASPITPDTQKPATQADDDRAAAEKAERQRIADERERERLATEKADRLREERAERLAQEKADREEKASRRGCFAYGRMYCELEPNLPIGAQCYCNGVPGVGVVGRR